MKRYCEACGKEVDTKIVTKKEIYDVCREAIEVNAKILTCVKCEEEFYCEELDNATLVNAYNEYRRRHKLLLPDEIKKIREQYGFSQRSFAKLLNWEEKTIYRYENGALQDRMHNSILVFLREPQNMKAYLLERDSLFQKTLSIENGFKAFDYEKLCAMVSFFGCKCKGVLKVKLLKLLNYSDMIFYKENGISMSGMKYVHLPYGPVPKGYEILFAMMEADKIMHIEVGFENGYEKHQVISDCNRYEGILNEKEIEVLERVYKKFADFGSAEISNYSHKEKGYQETKQGEVISYVFARDIQLD